MVVAKENIKVLIAEDHFVVRQMVANVMRDKNINLVDIANNGLQARDLMDQAYNIGQPYHIVFLDWDMPMITGIDLLKHYRAQPAFAATAFVMVTAMSMQAQVLEAVKAGATAYMIKPVSPASIGKKFDEMVAWVAAQSNAQPAAKKNA